MADTSKSFKGSIPRAAPGSYNSIAAQYARAKAAKDAEDRAKLEGEGEDAVLPPQKPKSVLQKINERKAAKFRTEWFWVLGFFVWLL